MPVKPEQKPAVLVVDDEASIVRVLQHILQKDYEVYTASSVPEAELVLEATPVKVLVCDNYMQGENGLSFLTRCSNSYPGIQRILLTGFTEPEMFLAAINDGHIFRYLVKPILPNVLRETVAEALVEHQKQAELATISRDYEGLKDQMSGVSGGVRRLRNRLKQSLGLVVRFLMTLAVVVAIFLVVVAVFGGVTLAALYVLKSTLGIDVFKNLHLDDLLKRF